jgi:small-conductance mechanosensitive channel
MSMLQRVAAAVLLALLLAVAYGLWATRQPADTPVQGLNGVAPAVAEAGGAMPQIDQQTLLTARRLASHATTPEEQPLAQQAVQTADRELDLAFAAALRHLEAHPPPLSAQASQIQQRVAALQKALDHDNDELKRLTAQLAQATDAGKPPIQDRLDLVKSQVELEQDELQEANDELLSAGGNVHQRVQLMQQEHEAAERSAAATPVTAASSQAATLHGLIGQVRQWLTLRRKQYWLGVAQQHASTSAAELATQRAKLAEELAANKARLPELAAHAQPGATAASAGAPPAPAPAAQPAPAPSTQPAATPAAEAPMTLLELTRRIAAQQQGLSLRDQRIAARKKLADIYAQWNAVVGTQARAVLHAALAGTTLVLAALLLLLVADSWLERLLGRARIDRRQRATLHSVVGVALQLAGVVVILLVLLGMPSQLGTMLGIAGAGLTVALKDFIVAFIGWFVLMGRNGMRVGDWVEINGVSGEVVELNMFHTVLLETGNWTDAGHPTGRRVTFTNSFAIEGHYFNFSTTGQWLWDELSVTVPYNRDAHAISATILKEVTQATEQDARQAEQEWLRASRGQRGSGFSAQPALAVRPDPGGVGVQLTVRYVTRASERNALRARLYQSAVELLNPQAA